MSKKGQEILSNAAGKVRYRLTNDYLFRAVMQRNKKVLVGLLSALLYLKPEDIKETVHVSILAFTLFPDYPEFYAQYQMLNVKNHLYKKYHIN